jgi:hypothetical protein
MPAYHSMPGLAQWRHDSSVALAVRKHDRVLTSIDQSIEAFERTADHYEKLNLACRLYFDLDNWLKTYRTDATIDRGRASAIEALYKFVAATYLCDRFRCTVNVLPRASLTTAAGVRFPGCGAPTCRPSGRRARTRGPDVHAPAPRGREHRTAARDRALVFGQSGKSAPQGETH